MSQHFVIRQKRIFLWSTRALFLTPDENILVSTPCYAYVLCSFGCQESNGTSFRTSRHIYRYWRQEKRILVDFTKMKREKVSEYSVILKAFYQFFVKVLTSRPARIFSKRVVTLFWVLGSLPQIRAIQRTLNHDRTTSQSFFIRKSLRKWVHTTTHVVFWAHFEKKKNPNSFLGHV